MDKNELLNNKKQLLEWVKQELIFKRLDLANLGLSVEEVNDNTLLFEKVGLDLDSVDGLELAVGIEQKLGLKVGSLKEDAAKTKFATPQSICDFVLELQLVKGQSHTSNS